MLSKSVESGDPRRLSEPSEERIIKRDSLAKPYAKIGAAIGLALGAIFGMLVILSPDAGHTFIATAVVVLSSLFALVGASVGAFFGLGIPSKEDEKRTDRSRRGRALVLVRTDRARAKRAIQLLDRYHPLLIQRRSAKLSHRRWWGFGVEHGARLVE